MADSRTYIKVHDGLPDHPKVESLSDRAFRLLVETWCWCSRHLTDGQVPKQRWAKQGTPKARRELEDAGLAVPNGTVVQMHDYLEHQRSAEQVTEIVQSRRRGAQRANHKRWHVGPNGRPQPDCPLCNDAESAVAEPSLERSLERDRSDPTHRSDPESSESESESEKINPTPPDALRASDPPAGGQRTRGSRLPDSFAVDAAMTKWAQSEAPDINIDRETERFKDYWRGRNDKGAVKRDWVATWRNWMRREQETAHQNNGSRSNGTTRIGAATEKANGWIAMARDMADHEQKAIGQ